MLLLNVFASSHCHFIYFFWLLQFKSLTLTYTNISSPSEQTGEISTPNVLKLSSDLRPLMFWMSNATELLNFFQVKVETMEKEWEFEGDFGTARFETPRRGGFLQN